GAGAIASGSVVAAVQAGSSAKRASCSLPHAGTGDGAESEEAGASEPGEPSARATSEGSEGAAACETGEPLAEATSEGSKGAAACETGDPSIGTTSDPKGSVMKGAASAAAQAKIPARSRRMSSPC